MALEDLIAFKLGTEGDFILVEDEFGNKDLELVSGEEYLAQSARIRLLTTQGEYPMNADFGFAYDQAKGIFNRPFIEGAVRRALKPDPDIEQVTFVEIELDGRTRVADVVVGIQGEDGANATVTGALL